MSFLSKLFGDSNERELNKLKPVVDKINSLEPKLEAFSDGELREQKNRFRKRLRGGENPDNLLPEAFAAVREAARRTLGERHFDVQLLGGIVLHQGKIAEMKTGEGKTLAATCPVYLNSLEEKGVHVATVNEYLAKRDAEWMGAIYRFLGLSVGVTLHGGSPEEKKEAYNADVTYGTNNEFGFDYLRDNMAVDPLDLVQRGLHFCIVDEVDSILIDEARTPLIISAPDIESTRMYGQFAQIVPRLVEGKDYNVDEKMRSVTITEEGINKIERMLGIDNIYEERGVTRVHHLEQALRAQALFHRDKDYIVKNGEVVIVDEFTGRLMPGRRYSEGLHQAIEAKEGVVVKQESRTLATVTFQNYFRLYKKLSGMTGTAATSAEEFSKVYNLDVVVVPTNEPMIRRNLEDVIYKTEQAKFKALIREIKRRYERGQPVLVGTIAIEKSEVLSIMLKKEGIPHEVLNAKNHEKEAKIIAYAGERGAVTISTNMAGRGTDIKLGKGVVRLGGLHVIGTERHEARRIDNQLRGRSGRQGDPGSSQFYLSLEDDVMRIFGSDRIKNLMDRLGLPDDQPIKNKLVSRAIESAQAKVEGYNFDARKHVLEYDDVINKQREVIYKKRRKLLGVTQKKQGLKRYVTDLLKEEIKSIISFHTADKNPNNWNIEEIYEACSAIFPVNPEAPLRLKELRSSALKEPPTQIRDKIIRYLWEESENAYKAKGQSVGSQTMRVIEKAVLFRSIDTLWMEHLDEIDHLRRGIGLRGYGQRDPLVEYKREAFQMFARLLKNIQSSIANTVFKVKVIERPQSELEREGIQARGVSTPQGISSPKKEGGNILQAEDKDLSQTIRTQKVGRNDPCPCGKINPETGKPMKYKKCCYPKYG